jgi:hypothetical protein
VQRLINRSPLIGYASGNQLAAGLLDVNQTGLLRHAGPPHFRKPGLSHQPKRGSILSMSVTLTVDLDSEILQVAEQEARAHHTTLPEVVAHQLRLMARNWQDSRAAKTPVTDALRGAVKLSADFDERAALTEELQETHGVHG